MGEVWEGKHSKKRGFCFSGYQFCDKPSGTAFCFVFIWGLVAPPPTPYKKGDRLWRLWRLIRAVEDSTHWITGSDLGSVNTILALYCHMMTIISDCCLFFPSSEDTVVILLACAEVRSYKTLKRLPG